MPPRFRGSPNGIAVKGLNCDGTDKAVALLDLETLEVEDWVNLPASARSRTLRRNSVG